LATLTLQVRVCRTRIHSYEQKWLERKSAVGALDLALCCLITHRRGPWSHTVSQPDCFLFFFLLNIICNFMKVAFKMVSLRTKAVFSIILVKTSLVMLLLLLVVWRGFVVIFLVLLFKVFRLTVLNHFRWSILPIIIFATLLKLNTICIFKWFKVNCLILIKVLLLYHVVKNWVMCKNQFYTLVTWRSWLQRLAFTKKSQRTWFW
jgi:hypothetical protein